MHAQNFPRIFTGLKIPIRLLGSFRAGAGAFFIRLARLAWGVCQ